MTYEAERTLMCAVGKLLYDRGYVAANDGNLSIKVAPERLLVTPSGVSKGRMTPDMLLVTDLEGHVLSGDRYPSSEIALHLEVYRRRSDVGAVVLRDRQHLAQDGMIVVVVSMSGEDGQVISGPDIITRGFVYVKESEALLEELRQVAVDALNRCQDRNIRDWSTIKGEIKGDLSGYLYKKTKRNPMILPVIMEV